MNGLIVNRLTRAGEMYGALNARNGKRQLELESRLSGGGQAEADEAERRVGNLGKEPLKRGNMAGVGHDPFSRWKRVQAAVRGLR